MSDIYLHHFDASPFAEKIRTVLGLKGLAWKSVQIPMIMPKPDLMALTGGYRKTPVMQIGAEIYCDTRRIAVELEHRWPEPTLFPGGNRGLSLALANWGDTAFFEPGAGLSMGVNKEVPEAVINDRKDFFNFMDFGILEDEIPYMYMQLVAQAAYVEEQLADGRDFLLGAEPGWADIIAWFVVWMARGNIAPIGGHFEPFSQMARWEERMAAIGHGSRDDVEAGEALQVARDTEALAGAGISGNNPLGLAEGQDVRITPTDYGCVPVEGRLIGLGFSEISINRDDDRAGNVNVHFPHAGYRVEAA